MKSKIDEILYKHSERIGLYEGGVITCINENEFDDIAEEIVKLFTIPAVINSGKTTCPNCDDRGWLYDKDGRRTGTCPCHY